MEQWKEIKGYEGYYEVSDKGRVRSVGHFCRTKGGVTQFRQGKVLKEDCSDKRGYRSVRLCKEGATKKYLVHRIVAQTFIPNPYSLPCVDHINDKPEDNSVLNLTWVDWDTNNNKEHHINALRTATIGYKHSEEAKKKMSEAKKGHVPWNKGLRNGSRIA